MNNIILAGPQSILIAAAYSMGKKYRTFEIYLVHVDPDKCDGCEECAKFCPVDVFDMSQKAYPVRPQNCLGCGTCVAVCKSKAIIITEI